MIRYDVMLDCEPAQGDAFAESLERYMRGTHIPEILATGCFRAIRFDRAGPGRFRTSYAAASRADLERYLADHTPHFRADFLAHFPTGVTVTREIWEEREAWPA